MPRGIPQTTYRSHPLPKHLQPRFDALVARIGSDPAAALLGVGKPTIDRLLYGGSASPESVARVAVKLEEVDRG